MRSGSRFWPARRCRLGLLVGLALALLAALPALAQTDTACTLPALRTDTRPQSDGAPTEVAVGVLVADVTGINDIAQTISLDVFWRLQWQDPRLAGFAGCRFHKTEIWYPYIELFNSNDLRPRRTFAADQVEVGADGRVTYLQRTTGAVSTYHNLRHFPFDRHRLIFPLADFEHDATALRLVADQAFTNLAGRLNIPDWTVERVGLDSAELFVAEFDRTYSVATLEIDVVRHSAYFIGKVLIPLALIVMMSWTVFWIDPVKFGPQIGLAATAMLTLIAFQFATATILPRLSYFTTLDRLILGSTVLVFLALVEVTATAALVVRGRDDMARRLDTIARWIFPLAFILWWAGVFVMGARAG